MDITDTLYNCTRGTFHSDECDGNCGEYEPNETDIELMHEMKRWEMLGFPFTGVPSVMANTPFKGILVDPLEILLRIQSLTDLLIDKGILTKEEVDDAMAARTLKRMTILREKIEHEQMKQRLALVQNRIVDPTGKPFQ